MYKGFPVGFLLFWETGADPDARQIGSGESAPRLLIVDGQQRLTSLFAVMTGTEVLREDYTEAKIRIAFRPTDATFAVSDAAIEKDPEYIPDISVLWEPGRRKSSVRAFLRRLSEKRGDLNQEEEDRLDDAIDRLYDLHNYTFKAMELAPEADEEQVAEIFVRINSEGVTLNQADFILTLMSVFWEKGRRELEDFCRDSKQPTLSGASPFNWHIRPQPPQVLRVTVALAFRRAVLKNVYTLLRGRQFSDLQLAAGDRGQERGLSLRTQVLFDVPGGFDEYGQGREQSPWECREQPRAAPMVGVGGVDRRIEYASVKEGHRHKGRFNPSFSSSSCRSETSVRPEVPSPMKERCR
jgi:hypothetical protein